jgi:hypothetical protein
VPGYVEDELRGYLECGILCFRFARALRTGCGTGFVVSFSCKSRGVGPACNGRPMPQTAASRRSRHEDRDVFQPSPAETPAIDIRTL